MYIAILGRQPSIGMAELERLFGDVTWFTENSACIQTRSFDVTQLGGTLKAGLVVGELSGDWRRASEQLVKMYSDKWGDFDGKITLGISAYGFKVSERDIQKTGIILKKRLRAKKVSLRLIPNATTAHNTATSHHNKLGLSNNKVELLVVRSRTGKVIIAESVGSQNITALSKRDQERPARDAFVGMLPPKLALTMVNLGVGRLEVGDGKKPVILDPFCGTGVILQESLLIGFKASGTDLSDKMVEYTKENLEWLETIYPIRPVDYSVAQADAMDYKWQQPIDAVVAEGYLGQPFSAPPSADKLAEVVRNCDHIMSEFLKNIASQIKSGTPLCIALPAWRSTDDSFTHLPLINKIAQLGYEQVMFKNVRTPELLYYREDQVVARELLILVKK